MMYHNKLAVAIKSNGKVLREFGEVVYLPFGAEYTIFIKNLHNVRVRVNITIDGQDVTGGGLIISAASESELKRSVSNGNMAVGNAFKFIERTETISDHRGDRVDDGIVRIEYCFEQAPVYQSNNILRSGWFEQQKPQPTQWPHKDRYTLTCNMLCEYNATSTAEPVGITTTAAPGVLCQAQATSNVGITVPGSVVEQKFETVFNFTPSSNTDVIVLVLKGQSPTGAPVKKSVDVNAKPTCTTCGRKNKATAKFCTECGTSLTIV